MKLLLLYTAKCLYFIGSKIKHLALASLIVLFYFPVLAQTVDTTSQKHPADTIKVRQLNEVAVTATALSIRNTSPSPVQVLQGAQLEKLNSLSVADAIRFFSGVQLKDYGGVGGLKTVNVRSLGTNHVAVFYDGVEFGNSQNGQVDLGKFSLDNIQEIALYNAQKSTIFQPAKGFASGSAIYLTARQPVFKDSSRSVGKVSFKTGSFGLINPSLFWQYKLSDNIYSTFSAELTDANGRYKFRSSDGGYDTTAVRHNADISAQRVEAGLNGKLKDSSAWDIKGYIYNSDRGLPAAVVRHNFTSTQREWDRNIFFQGSYKKGLSKRDSIMFSAKYSNDYTKYLDPNITNLQGLLQDKYYEHEYYLSAANKFKINSFWDVDLSADYQINTLNASENDSAQYRFVNPVRHTLLAVAATGVHFERFNAQVSLLGTFVNDTVDTLTAGGRKTEYTPAVLFSWQPTDNPDLRLRGFYKDIFRLPTFNDLYFTFVGNSFLKPEFTRQYDLGFTYNKTFKSQSLVYFAVQTDGYYNNVTDKIVAIPGQNLARWTMYNLGKVHITGLEVDAQATWALPGDVLLNTSINYTYQKAIDVTVTVPAEVNYGQQIPYTPFNSASLLISAEWRRFTMNYSFLYTGARYDEPANIPENYLQPWYTHDAGITYTTHYNSHKIKLTAEVNNVFNQDYEVILDYPMPGRNYRFTISSTF